MLRKFKKSNNGVVGIVVAVLLIGLMVSVVSLLQMVYVPKWMEQREAEHMDVVDAQFSQLKFAIDTQSSTGQFNIPIATSITLGSKELPYLMSIRAFGQLEILSDAFILRITNASNTFNYSIGTIEYSSSNAYYLDQSFIYEAGAIITSQQEGNMVSIECNGTEQQEELTDSYRMMNLNTLTWQDSPTAFHSVSFSKPGQYSLKLKPVTLNQKGLRLRRVDLVPGSMDYKTEYADKIQKSFRPIEEEMKIFQQKLSELNF